MASKKYGILFSVLAVTLLIGGYLAVTNYTLLLQTVFPPEKRVGYLTYDDFASDQLDSTKWNLKQGCKVSSYTDPHPSGCTAARFFFGTQGNPDPGLTSSNSQLWIQGPTNFAIESKDNFDSMEWQIPFSLYNLGSCLEVDYPGCHAVGPVKVCYGDTHTSRPLGIQDSHIVELLRDPAIPHIGNIYLDGRLVCLTDDNTKPNADSIGIVVTQEALNTESLSSVEGVYYKPLFGICKLNAQKDEMMAVETVQPNIVHDMASLRYRPTKFCATQDAILYDPASKGYDHSSYYYQQLINGQNVTSPFQITYFYIFENRDLNGNKIFPTTCDFSAGQALNVDSGQCQGIGGLVKLCGAGETWDSTLLQCVSQPVPLVTQCEGTLLNTSTGMVCKTVPPLNQICASGTFNNATGTCQSSVKNGCPSGYSFVPLPNNLFTCEKNLTTQTVSVVAPTQVVPSAPSSTIAEKVALPSEGEKASTGITDTGITVPQSSFFVGLAIAATIIILIALFMAYVRSTK